MVPNKGQQSPKVMYSGYAPINIGGRFERPTLPNSKATFLQHNTLPNSKHNKVNYSKMSRDANGKIKLISKPPVVQLPSQCVRSKSLQSPQTEPDSDSARTRGEDEDSDP